MRRRLPGFTRAAARSAVQRALPGARPPLEDPDRTLDAFEARRRERIRQVQETLAARPEATTDELVAEVYGTTIPEGLEAAAGKSVEAIRDFLV